METDIDLTMLKVSDRFPKDQDTWPVMLKNLVAGHAWVKYKP